MPNADSNIKQNYNDKEIFKKKDGMEIVWEFIAYTNDSDIKISSAISKKVTKKVNVRFEFVLK